MKILLLGKNGQVGWELQRAMATLGEIVALDKEELDLLDFARLKQTVHELKPDLIVNAAAYTAVDKAEEEPDLAMTINGTVPGILAEEAKKINAALIHYSTDYVFDGTKNKPYTEDDEPNPLNVYGKTKLAGEKAIQAVGGAYLIFRTSWIYGMRGQNFLLTILRLAREREELRVVDDQIGAPTWCRMIAEGTAQVVAQGIGDVIRFIEAHSGIYNLTASGNTSWFGFVKAILEKEPSIGGKNETVVIPVKTDEYPTKAQRPKNSSLANGKLNNIFGINLPNWKVMLGTAVERG